MYYPAWDQVYSSEMMKRKLEEAEDLIDLLKNAVSLLDDGADIHALTDWVCDNLQMTMLKMNPLFSRTVECLRERNDAK